MEKLSSLSFLEASGGWTSVDAWESTGILSAAEASVADEYAVALKKDLRVEEGKLERLAESARECVKDMSVLLGKVELSTATKAEVERLARLDAKMKSIKRDITESKSSIKIKTEELMRSKTKSKEYALMKTAKERDIRSVIRLVREAEAVDLAFLLDCTGSMGSHIEAAKTSIKGIVRRVKSTNQGLQLRVAVVGYRDLADAQRFEVLDFNTCTDTFETFVGALRAGGGGDGPEDIAGAIQQANNLSWAQTSRVVFLIADAPCHGREFHDMADDYPCGTPGIDIRTELKILMDKGGQAGMSLHFGRITSYCDKMIRLFEESGVAFETCDLKDPRKLASSVTTSVRKSISKSITASRSKSKSKTVEYGSLLSEESATSIKDYTICEAKPSPEEWKAIKAKPVRVLKNKPVKSINDLRSPLFFGAIRFGKSASSMMDEENMLLRRAKDPFAEGESRLAFYGKMGTSPDSCDVVVKSFKNKGSKASTDRKRYLSQMEVSTIANFLAQKYNEEARPSHCAEVSFLNVCVVEDEDGKERFCAEEILPGAADTFTKFSNNTGYWNEDEINQSLLLFTRFTHEITRGYLMVTDLQGVRHGNKYMLTDPAILCQDAARFGQTNLGQKFMDKCTKSTTAMLEEFGWDD